MSEFPTCSPAESDRDRTGCPSELRVKSAIQIFSLGYGVDPENRQIFCAAQSNDPDHPLDDPDCWRVWDPLDKDTALFRKFALIGEQYRRRNWPDGMTRANPRWSDAEIRSNVAPEIVEFAGKYGLPGNDVDWVHHYAMLIADGIDVMDAILTDDRATLRKYFPKGEDGWGATLTLFGDEVDPFSSEPSPPGLVPFARSVLELAITAIPHPTISLKTDVALSGERVVCGSVTELIHVIWLQFAAAYLGGKQYRECATCGSPFEISPDVHRTNRKFCSDTCRVKHYQRRKAKAIKLRAAGEKLRVIAKETGTDIKKVKEWLGED